MYTIGVFLAVVLVILTARTMMFMSNKGIPANEINPCYPVKRKNKTIWYLTYLSLFCVYFSWILLAEPIIGTKPFAILFCINSIMLMIFVSFGRSIAILTKTQKA